MLHLWRWLTGSSSTPGGARRARWLYGVMTLAFGALLGCSTLAACEGGSTSRMQVTPPAETAAAWEESDELTLDELINRMAEALTRPGQVAHVRVQSEGPLAIPEVHYWLDMASGTARVEGSMYGGEEGLIVNGDGAYSVDSDGDSQRFPPPECMGSSLVPLTDLVDRDCLLYRFSGTPTVKEGEFEGRPAIVVEASGYFPGGPDEDDLVDLSYRVYADAETYVPRGVVSEYTYVYDERRPGGGQVARFEVEFVPRDSLPPDFFDPAAVGYAEPDLEAEMDALDGEIYWLGQDFSGSTSLPALTLDDVWSPERLSEEVRQDSGHVGTLYYREAEDPFGFSVGLQQHRRDPASEEYFGQPTRLHGRCTSETQPITLADGYAVIFGEAAMAEGGVCPAPTHYVGNAFLGDTIVSVIVSANTGHPFDSAEGMEHLLRGLRLRE